MNNERFFIFEFSDPSNPNLSRRLDGGYSALNPAIRECSALNQTYEAGTRIHFVWDNEKDSEVFRRGYFKKE